MLTWTLFYTSIFDVRKAPTVDVVDPGGLVRSRAIESPDGALRLTLNGAESHRTLAGRFIADSFGSSVQHIAFATDDIFATAAALAEGGLATLSISPNYYDDLVARFELSADEIARLRAAHILYDRDENGAFFQLYTEPFGDGMFFEIVERRDGYAGYGAANAPFRIAAQKRAMRHAAVPRR
jgi:4-hydroxyphenylpyruvate dioxygenase